MIYQRAAPLVIGIGLFLGWSDATGTNSPGQIQPGDPQKSVEETVEATVPLLNVGDTWLYSWRSPKGEGSARWIVKGEEALDGVTYYVVTSGKNREYYFRKSDLALGMTKLDGQLELHPVPPALHYVWPLVRGRQWEYTIREATPRPNTPEERLLACNVEVEDVTVPAGTFKSFKVECRDKLNSGQSSIRWYSPEVKNSVREVFSTANGKQVRELLSFRIDGKVTPCDENRVGGEVLAPRLVNRVEPAYPEAARRAHIGGVVVLEGLITTSGDVAELRVLKSVDPLLDAAALRAVQQWRYSPATKDGKPVCVYLTITTTFTPGARRRPPNSLLGLWQVPGQQTWVWIGADNRSYQCRINLTDVTSTAAGVVSGTPWERVIRWQSHWSIDRVRRDGDQLVLAGREGIVKLLPSDGKMPDSCAPK